MGRWKPDAAGRLRQAALELYSERGYEQTTVAEIAARAGLTERTFFRHYADKREVLFEGSDEMVALIVTAAESAPAQAAPVAAVALGLAAAAAFFDDDLRPFSRQRQLVIGANPELRERELAKLAFLGAALTDALRRRGVPDLSAQIAAEAGVAAFRVAFERWLRDDSGHEYPWFVGEAFDALRLVAAA